MLAVLDKFLVNFHNYFAYKLIYIIIQYSYNLDCDWLKNLQTILDVLPPIKYQKLSVGDV